MYMIYIYIYISSDIYIYIYIYIYISSEHHKNAKRWKQSSAIKQLLARRNAPATSLR